MNKTLLTPTGWVFLHLQHKVDEIAFLGLLRGLKICPICTPCPICTSPYIYTIYIPEYPPGVACFTSIIINPLQEKSGRRRMYTGYPRLVFFAAWILGHFLLTYHFPWEVHSVFPCPVNVRIKLNDSYQEMYCTRPQLFMKRNPFGHLHVAKRQMKLNGVWNKTAWICSLEYHTTLVFS